MPYIDIVQNNLRQVDFHEHQSYFTALGPYDHVTVLEWNREAAAEKSDISVMI